MRNSIFIILSVVMFSCKTSETTADKTKEENLTVIELKTGHNSGFTQAVNKVINTQEELNEVWTVLFANYMKKEESPEVNFSENMLILVAAGERNSGGYSIKVEDAKSTSDKVQVTVVTTVPGKNCMTTEAITYPFQLVQIDKSNHEVVFTSIEKTIDCDSE